MVVKRKRVELEKRAAEQKAVEKAAKLAKKQKEKRDFERQTREVFATARDEVYTPDNGAPTREEIEMVQPEPLNTTTKPTPNRRAAAAAAARRVAPKKPKVVTF